MQSIHMYLISHFLTLCMLGNYSPTLKKWGLYWIWVVCHSVIRSFFNTIIPSFRHNFFVSAQYLENSFIEYKEILYVHLYWHDLAWDCYTTFLGYWFMPKFCFRSISWEQINRFSPNFIYAFILTRSSLGLLHIIFYTLGPWFTPKFCFRSISREQIDWFSPSFIYFFMLLLLSAGFFQN